jgi:NADH-quinone oxidoreductase subunit C
MQKTSSKLFDQLKEKYKDSILGTHSQCGDETVIVSLKSFKNMICYLKQDPEWQMNYLVDITAVDYFGEEREERFEIVYHLSSFHFKRRIRIKVPVPEKNLEVETLSDLWPAANWLEREVWDMFGIRFKGHPDLRRLFMAEEFEGHPLRKDYPYSKQQPLIKSE